VALDYGISMNARGGPGIVLASLAFDAKIIDSALFTTFVLISLVTSAIAGLWLRLRKDAI
jgi:Kef-type K+ transport system membrane component KefB